MSNYKKFKDVLIVLGCILVEGLTLGPLALVGMFIYDILRVFEGLFTGAVSNLGKILPEDFTKDRQ